MKLRYDFHIVEIGDSSVAVAVGKDADTFHKIIECNETAAAILNMLGTDMAESQIIENIKAHYSAADGEIEKYVHQFLERLQ